DIPYLHPPVVPETVALVRGRIVGRPGLKAGIVWRGNPGNTHDRRRSIDAPTIAPLCGLTGVSWFSLQVDARADEIAAFARFGTIEDLGPMLTDWSQTAAALSALDLIVTVDTAVAHLAGALGRRAY